MVVTFRYALLFALFARYVLLRYVYVLFPSVVVFFAVVDLPVTTCYVAGTLPHVAVAPLPHR